MNKSNEKVPFSTGFVEFLRTFYLKLLVIDNVLRSKAALSKSSRNFLSDICRLINFGRKTTCRATFRSVRKILPKYSAIRVSPGARLKIERSNFSAIIFVSVLNGEKLVRFGVRQKKFKPIFLRATLICIQRI